MKKTILALIALLGMSTAHADEGMWTIYNLPQAVYDQMQAEGFQMTYNDLYYGPTSLKAACVNFSGYCSGVVVSPDGLVFTIAVLKPFARTPPSNTITCSTVSFPTVTRKNCPIPICSSRS